VTPAVPAVAGSNLKKPIVYPNPFKSKFVKKTKQRDRFQSILGR
jgi:hypothetical protein